MAQWPAIIPAALEQSLSEAIGSSAKLQALRDQLDKDVSLCGLPGFSAVRFSDFETFFNDLLTFTETVRANQHAWQSFIYRIDLPTQLDLNALDNRQMVWLILARTAHKITLRNRFKSHD